MNTFQSLTSITFNTKREYFYKHPISRSGANNTTQHNTAAAAETKEFDHREEVALIIFFCCCSFRSCLLGSKFGLYLLFTVLVALQKSFGCSFLFSQRMFLSLQYPPGITPKVKYFPSITVPFLSLLTPRSSRLARLEKSLE